MNGSYYENPMFPGNSYYERDTNSPEDLPNLATVYMSFTDSISYRDKIFTGIIEQAGRDHIILSDPNTGKWYMLLMIYLDYVEFNDKINYK